MRRVRIGFLLPHYSHKSKSFMPGVVRMLGESGAVAEIVHPVDRIVDLSKVRVEHDLYVLRNTNSGFSLSVAGALHELGAVIVNPYRVSMALRDKILASRILQASGVPTPDTYVASHTDQLVPLLDLGPLVIKPYQGAGGHNVRIVQSRAELAEVNFGREPVFAQRYLPNDGRDRKIYAIGGQIFGVKKVFPRRTEEEKHGELFPLSPELQEVALSCGRAFGIDLYGVDIIESEGKPYVVDMCSIPGFKGVPDAPRLLAQYFYAAAERAARGQPVPQTAASAAAGSHALV
jgi:ribosomal protein S6--L-glutamate ligase